MNDIIKCPKCHEDVEINIARSCDEDGEVFRCPHCGWYIRYVKQTCHTIKYGEER